MVVSILPGNALAFETNLPNAPAERFIAPVRVERTSTNKNSFVASTSGSYRAHTAIAVNNPVTTAGERKPVINETATKIAYTPPTQAVIPANSTQLVLEGEASYYSRAGCLGCDPRMIMANGQPLNDNALTMAIGADKKHLVGRQARVTNLATGLSTTVTITDTGGFYKARYGHRVADLTIATKTAIGMAGGVGQVRVEVF